MNKELITLLVQGSLILFVASIGLRARWRDVVASFGDAMSLMRGIVAVNIVVPLAAVLMCELLPIERATRIGIIIMAVSPLAPFVVAKMMKAGLSASQVIGLYVSLTLVSVILVPATVALLSMIFPVDAWVSVASIAKMVALAVLLPLAGGIIIAETSPAAARRLAPVFAAVGAIVLLLFLVAVLAKTGSQMASLVGDGTLLAIVVTVVAGLLAGHLLGGPNLAERESLAFAAATRHPGIAVLIAKGNFNDQRVLAAIVLFLVTSVVVSAIYQIWMKKLAGRQPASPA